ncbi:MAG: hemin uptake protein HemP [Paracoccaceae bacterium]
MVNPAPNALPTYAAEDLTKGAERAQIILGTQTYFLRITRAGKLILTK